MLLRRNSHKFVAVVFVTQQGLMYITGRFGYELPTHSDRCKYLL